MRVLTEGRRLDPCAKTHFLPKSTVRSGSAPTGVSSLPLPVDDSGASATYRDGILTIELPLGARDRFPIVRTEIRMTVKRTLA